MIKSIDGNTSGFIELDEFTILMMPIMLDHVFSEEDSVESFRAYFREADVDGNGFLSIDEFYMILKKMKIEVTKNEFMDLMMEFDIDRDMKLDIDEFVLLLTRGEELTFTKVSTKQTYFKIKKGRQIEVKDFMDAFKNLPMAF
jgi:Ca2+-binding EF-hand superfamily protein